MDFQIIGVSGEIGVGKDYIVKNFILKKWSHQGALVVCLADHFKVDAVAKHHKEFSKVFDKKDTETRKLLQKLGTEEGRNVFGLNIWMRTAFTWMKLHSERSGITTFIIADVRFKNEVAWIQEMGGIVIRVISPQRNHQKVHQESNGDVKVYAAIREHISEAELRNESPDTFDYIVHNDEHDDLPSQMNNILKSINN